MLRWPAGSRLPESLKLPPLWAQGKVVLEVYSSVHSETFPAKSYIPILLNESSVPVDNNIPAFEAFAPYAPSVHFELV